MEWLPYVKGKAHLLPLAILLFDILSDSECTFGT